MPRCMMIGYGRNTIPPPAGTIACCGGCCGHWPCGGGGGGCCHCGDCCCHCGGGGGACCGLPHGPQNPGPGASCAPQCMQFIVGASYAVQHTFNHLPRDRVIARGVAVEGCYRGGTRRGIRGKRGV